MVENEGSNNDYDEVATDNVSTKPIEGSRNNRDDIDVSKCSKSNTNPSTTNITNITNIIVRENVDSTIVDKGSNNDYDEVTTDNVSTKPIESNGNNRDDIDISKHSESNTNPSTTNITNIIVRENVDRSSIIDKGSNNDYNEAATDNVSTKPIEGNGNNRDDVDTSKCSKSKRIPSTTNIVREIINSMIDNISDKATDQIGDNLVHISSKNDILNDIEDDDSSSIDLEMYTVASHKLTTSINNALSLLHEQQK